MKSIEADDTSLINRPLSAFSAGSVFKVVLAQAAYEAGYSWYTHDCTGSVEVGIRCSAVPKGVLTVWSICAVRWNKAATVILLSWDSCWAVSAFCRRPKSLVSGRLRRWHRA